MSAVQPILIIFLVVGLMVVAIWLGARARRLRREALAALARSLGWSFDPSPDRSHDDEYAHFELFRRGHGRAAYNTLQGTLVVGERPCPARMGDFRYKVTRTTGKRTSTTTYRFSYLIVHLPFGRVPDLRIRGEGLFDRIAGAVGFDDIDFESEEFSRRFFVKSPDKKFAYDVIHPRMMEFLMGSDPLPVDMERGRCLITDGSSRWRPEDFPARLEWARTFLGLWPEYLVRDLEAPRPS